MSKQIARVCIKIDWFSDNAATEVIHPSKVCRGWSNIANGPVLGVIIALPPLTTESPGSHWAVELMNEPELVLLGGPITV